MRHMGTRTIGGAAVSHVFADFGQDRCARRRGMALTCMRIAVPPFRPCEADFGLLRTFFRSRWRNRKDDALKVFAVFAPSARRSLLLLAGLLIALPLSLSSASAQGTVKGTFGDWELRCDQAPQIQGAGQPQAASQPAREQCILYQNIADEKDDALSLRISVSKVFDPKAPGVRRPVLLVVARLGVLLPRGLALRIDQTEIGSTGFVRCIPEGCVAQVDMDDALLDKFRKGTIATFIIALTPEEQRGLPLALAGFDKGYEALQ